MTQVILRAPPPQLTVLEHNSQHTKIEVEIPGMWIEDVFEGGMEFQRISLPEYAYTGEVGLPEIPVIRELLGIPPDGEVESVEIVSSETTVLDDFYIYPFQTPRLDIEGLWGYLGSFDYDDYFYDQDVWYPEEDGETIVPGLTDNESDEDKDGKIGDIFVENLCINPIKFNPLRRKIEVSTNFELEIKYSQEKNTEFHQDYSYVNINEMSDMLLSNLLLNYEFLNINSGKGDIHYLVIYDVDHQSVVDEFTDFISHRFGYEMHTITTDEVGYTTDDFHACIEKFYNGYGLHNYVLLADWVIEIPHSGMNDIPSDYVYGCVEGDDLIPEVFVGRYCLSQYDNSLDKITEHYQCEQSFSTVLIAHKNAVYCENIGDIRKQLHDYPYKPNSFSCQTYYGKDEGIDDDDIIWRLSYGAATCMYRGHGAKYDPDYYNCWHEWNERNKFPWLQHFNIEDVEAIECGVKRAVVFSISCSNAAFDADNPGSLCSNFIFDENGAVATVGFTVDTYTDPNSHLAKKIYEAIYGLHPDAPYSPLYPLLNWATISMLTNYPWATVNVISLVYFGDPTLRLHNMTSVPPDELNKSVMRKSETEKVSILGISPNPVTGDDFNIQVDIPTPDSVEVSIYDISGRIVNKIEGGEYQPGEHTINIDTSFLSSGVYILHLSSSNTDIQKNIVVVR